MDEKLDLILSRLAALEADLGELKIAASERGRLTDCTEKDPALCELFIVEGDLAGMSCKQGRNPLTQAVLRLEGKILNVEKARFDNKLSTSDLQALSYALGPVMDKDHFDIKNLRYHKIILLCEDHVKGSRFGDLLLSFFHRHMPQLLEYKTGDGETKSFVYRAQPPFYRVWNGNDGLNSFRISGASGYYLRDDHEMNRCLIKKAAEKVTVRINTTGEKIEGEALSQLIEKLLEFGAFYQKLERKRIDQRLTETLLETIIGGEGLMRKDGLGLREIFADELLLGKVNAALAEAGYKTRLIPDEEPGLSAIEVNDGSDRGRRLINWELAAHVEFERAVDLYKSFLQPAPPPYLIQEGDSVIEIKSRGDLLSQILFLGAKNLGIQRFEHLGEMNPQQFWESTLDPEKRSLLQVKIDDAMKADELYTALISEQIESRSVQAVIDGLSETMNAVLEDVKEIRRDLKDLARGFNTLAGDGARLRAAYEELEARITTFEHKSS